MRRALSNALITLLLTPGLVACDAPSSAPKHRLTVIPSAAPRSTFQITITDERYLSDVARRLGTTVETLIRDNHLPDATIHKGQTLQVRCTEAQHRAFERGQVARVERRLERARAHARRLAAKQAAKEQARLEKIRRRVNKRKLRKRRKRRAPRRRRRK